MPNPPVNNRQAAYYIPHCGQETRDLTAEAYHKAVELLKQELEVNAKTQIPEERFVSIEDLFAAVNRAKKVHDVAPRKRAGVRKWFQDLSDRIMHYERVFDTLAQHHAEYVALVWGTLKLFVMTINNHAATTKGLAKALIDVADMLPRTRLSAELYRTPDMEAVLSRLYTSIFMFFRRCVEWYGKTSCGRMWSSFKDPISLGCSDEIADIQTCSRLVENLATGGAQVEIRSVHTLTQADHAMLIEMDARMNNAFEAHMTKLKAIEESVTRVHDRQTALFKDCLQIEVINRRVEEIYQEQKQIQAGVMQIYNIVEPSHLMIQQTHGAVFRLEMHEILKFFVPRTLPSTVLRRVHNLSRQNTALVDPRFAKKLGRWINNKHTSILVIHTKLSAHKDAAILAANLVSRLQRNGHLVLWHISAKSCGRGLTIEDLFKSMIYQVMEQRGPTFANVGEQLHPHKIHGSHTEQEWADLICMLFEKLPLTFVVIETKNMRDMYGDERASAEKLLKMLTYIVNRTAATQSQVQILLVMYGSMASTSHYMPSSEMLEEVKFPPVQRVPRHLKHKAMNRI